MYGVKDYIMVVKAPTLEGGIAELKKYLDSRYPSAELLNLKTGKRVALAKPRIDIEFYPDEEEEDANTKGSDTPESG